MSGEIWIDELEELKFISVLEGELEWVISVMDGDNGSRQDDFPTRTEGDEQE